MQRGENLRIRFWRAFMLPCLPIPMQFHDKMDRCGACIGPPPRPNKNPGLARSVDCSPLPGGCLKLMLFSLQVFLLHASMIMIAHLSYYLPHYFLLGIVDLQGVRDLLFLNQPPVPHLPTHYPLAFLQL